jgi:hypothetical protein
MGYGQGSLKEDPRTGNWKARYYGGDGKQHCKTFGPKEKTKARKFLAAQQTDRARGTWIDPRGAQVRFEEWAEEWFEGRHGLGAPARARDGSLLRCHILPAWGRRPLPDLRPLRVRERRQSLSGV